jgi:formyl-CoA transferase
MSYDAPFAGLKVIDLSQGIAGPYCAMLLAQYGAEVIKVEGIGEGDWARTLGTRYGSHSAYSIIGNLGKRSIAVDLKTDTGKQVLWRLLKGADVFLEGFRPGAIRRLGFDYDSVAAREPRLLYLSISGFGQSGPLSHKGGQDILAQALTGVMARKPDQGLPTSVYATALADYSAGMHLVQGILLALMQREKTGVGQSLSVSLYDSMLAMQMQEAAMWLQRKRELNWGAFPLTGVFETTDGAVVIVGAFKANPLQDICRALGLHDVTLARQIGGAGSPVRAGPDLGRGADLGADRREQHGGVSRRQRQRSQ